MRKFLFASLILLASGSTYAAESANLCAKKVEIAVTKYFQTYVEDSREEGIAQAAEDGYEYDENDTPGGLELYESSLENNKEVYSYGWGERQECACGVEVVGKLSKDGKSCKSVKVDYKSQSCECG